MLNQLLSSYELSHYGGRRDGGYLRRLQCDYIGQHLKQAACLFVGRRGLLYVAEQGLGVVLEQRQVVEHRGVEHHIGILLVREDVLDLALAYARPAQYRVFRERESELRGGINRIRCTSSWLLLGFAMSFSLTLSSHFYSTMAAGILCLGIVVGYGYWIWRKEYLGRILLAGILSVLMAILPMAIAFLTGKNLEGSMYWAMSLIGLREYTDLIFRILCLATVAGTVGGAVVVAVGIRQGKITLGDKPVPRPSPVQNGLLHLVEAALLVVLLLAGWHYRSTLLDSFQRLVLPALSKSGILYGMAAALLVGVLLRLFTRGQDGAACLSMLAAGIFWLFLLSCGNLGWPVL